MPQYEDLDIFGTITPVAQLQQVDHKTDKTVEAGHQPILAALRSHRSIEHEGPGQRTRRVSGTHTICLDPHDHLGRIEAFIDAHTHKVMDTGHPRDPISHTAVRHHLTVNIEDTHIVMILSPINPNEQHRSPPRSVHEQRRSTAS